MVPRKSRQRIRKARCRRFKVFNQCGLIIARVRIVAASGKFRFVAPAGLSSRINARNQVHQFRESRHGVLQAEVHAPQHAGVGFVAKRRSLGRRALTLVEGGNTEHGTRTHAIQVKREFCTGAKQQLVVDFEQGFAFVADLDFLVRVKGSFAQKFNLAEFVVDFVVGTANKGRRARRHLFGSRRNIHTRTTAHGIAGARVANTQGRTAALAHRFKVEAVRVARKVVDRQRIELSHRSRRIQVTQRFQAVLASQFVFVGFTGINRIISRFTRQPHFTCIITGSVFLKDCSIVHQGRSRCGIHQAEFLEEVARNARFVLHAQHKARRTCIRNTDRIHVTQHQLVDVHEFRKSCIPLDKRNRIAFFHGSLTIAVFSPASGKQCIAVHAVDLEHARFFVVREHVVVGILDFCQAFHLLDDSLSVRRHVPNVHIVDDFLGVRSTALVKLQASRLVSRSLSARNREFLDVSVPSFVVQEIIAVSDKLLIQNLEFRRRFARLKAVFFLVATILRGNGRKAPVAKLPVSLDTEQALVVLGVTREFRTRKSKVRGTGFYALQNVVFKFVLVRFFVNHTHLVTCTQAFFHVVDFDRDVRADFALHHEVRRVVQSRARPQARVGATFGVIFFTVALQANVHGTLKHQLRLVEAKVAHPCRHRHRDGNIKHRTGLGRLVAVVRLADQVVQPQALLAYAVHVRHVVRQFGVMRSPQSGGIARNGVHALFAHIHFTSRDINIVTKDLPLAGTHERGRRTNATERQKAVKRSHRRR